jgi:hypothetical protein
MSRGDDTDREGHQLGLHRMGILYGNVPRFFEVGTVCMYYVCTHINSLHLRLFSITVA